MSLPLNTSYKRIHLELAKNLCNCRCLFCYLGSTPQKYSPKNDFSYLDNIIDFCKKHFVEEIFVQGGEVTVIPEVYNFCKRIVAETDSYLSLVTNGLKFDDKWAQLYAKKGNDVNFSLNASNEARYKEICTGNFNKVVKNIKHFIEINNKATLPKCIVEVSMVVCTKTIGDIADFYDYAIELGVDKVQFFPDISSQYRLVPEDPVFRKAAHRAMDELITRVKARPEIVCHTLESLARCLDYPKALPEETRYLQARANNHNLPKVRYEDMPENRIYKKCLYPWTSFFIDDSQNVYVCCLSLRTPLGNLQHQTLEEVIHNEERKKFQERFAGGNVCDCSQSCQLLYK